MARADAGREIVPRSQAWLGLVIGIQVVVAATVPGAGKHRLGMSRIPIREALRLLIEDGLVTKIPHRGAFVFAPTELEIEEISSLRVVLERFVVERAVPRYTLEHESRLQRIVHEMRGTAFEGDFKRLYELDREFHGVLWEVADHGLLLEVVSSLRSRLNRFLYEAAIATSGFKFDLYIASHTKLLKVLSSGDVVAAQEAMTQHILSSKERILAYAAALAMNGVEPSYAPE
jgi:DNA-binding GntR family transcriptional regulator